MPRRVLISALAAAAVVIPFPAAALADSSPSAGDSQYVDPLAGTHSSSSSSGSGSASGSGSGAGYGSGSGSSTPAAGSPSSTPPASAAASSSSSSSTGSAAAATGGSGDPRGKLPFTGADTELIALIGLGLTGAGLVLRRRGTPARD